MSVGSVKQLTTEAAANGKTDEAVLWKAVADLQIGRFAEDSRFKLRHYVPI